MVSNKSRVVTYLYDKTLVSLPLDKIKIYHWTAESKYQKPCLLISWIFPKMHLNSGGKPGGLFIASPCNSPPF